MPKRKTESKSDSATTPKRKFNETWRFAVTGVREWLVYNNDTKTMCCRVCQKYSTHRSCSFVVGNCNMKLETIKDREKSNAHVKAVTMSKVSEQPIPYKKKNCVVLQFQNCSFTAVLLQFPTVLLQYLCSKCAILDTKKWHTAEILHFTAECSILDTKILHPAEKIAVFLL